MDGSIGEIGRKPTALVSAIRGVVASIDKEQPTFGVATMQDVVNASVSTQRITLILLGLFSGLALVLAGIGIYGVIAYSSRSARTRSESGWRWAPTRRCARLVLAQGGGSRLQGL